MLGDPLFILILLNPISLFQRANLRIPKFLVVRAKEVAMTFRKLSLHSAPDLSAQMFAEQS